MKKILLFLIAILTPFICISGANAAIDLRDIKPLPNLTYTYGANDTSGTYNIRYYYQINGLSSNRYCSSYDDATNTCTDFIYKNYYAQNVYYNTTAKNDIVNYVFNPGDDYFLDGYYYGATLYYCFEGSNVPTLNSIYIGNLTNSTNHNNTQSSYTGIRSAFDIKDVYLWNGNNVLTTNTLQLQDWSCRTYKVNFTPDQRGSYIAFRFDHANNEKTYLLGYNVESLGLSKDVITSSTNDIQTTIEEQEQATQDAINNQTQQDKEQHEETIDTLTNSDAPDGMDSLGSASGWLPPGPVDSLLTLPLSMLNNISTSLGSSCRPINLPIPFVDKNLTMPCLNTIYSQITGLGVFLNSIGTIAAGFMLYYYFKKLYAYIDNLLSLKNNGEGWGDV